MRGVRAAGRRASRMCRAWRAGEDFVAEAEENNLDHRLDARWHLPSAPMQTNHGVVARAHLGMLEDVLGASGGDWARMPR